MPVVETPYQHITHAANILRAGGVVAFPTETVYGLGASALNEAAVARVFQLKGRPSNNPLIVHVSGKAMASRVLAPGNGGWNERADRLARAFWPGPLSIVLEKSALVPDRVSAGASTIAVRCPDHPVALALLFELGLPLVGPSANRSGHISPTTAEHVRSAFSAEDVYVLDGGACRVGIESSVVSLTGPGHARLLRPGLISAAEIAEVLGEPVDAPPSQRSHTSSTGPTHPVGPLESPGQLERHYAPRTPARLFDQNQWPEVLRSTRGKRVAILSHRLVVVDPPAQLIEMPPEPDGYAAALYAALHRADVLADIEEILIERPPSQGPIWEAIADRLKRATHVEGRG